MNDPTGRPGARRELTYAVLCCLVGAGLATFAVTRGWVVELTTRPVPLPALRTVRTGADLMPWMPALAAVGLAGAGAMLATRGVLRRLVGVLLLGVGLALVGGAGYALTAQSDGPVSRQWPVLALLGGVLTTAGGVLTALRGQRWPAMGARYDRPASRPEGPATADDAGSAPAPVAADDAAAPSGVAAADVAGRPSAGVAPDVTANGSPTPRAAVGARRTVDAWDALDRGEDPTVD